MKVNQLKTIVRTKRHRIGRGISAGQGKTAGRGTKGQNARTGGGRRPGFEGGQNPMYMRLPKLRGFTSTKAKTFTVYTGQLNDIGGHVDNAALVKAGLVPHEFAAVKVVSKGELTKKVTVSLQAASETAFAAIQKSGGSFTAVPRHKRPAKKAADAK